MKKILFFMVFTFAFANLFSQEADSILADDNLNPEIHNPNPAQYMLITGASFGRGFFAESFSETFLGASGSFKLNEQSWLRVGAMTGDTRIKGNLFSSNPEDKAPYANHYRRNAAYIGMDFELNKRALLSVTAFYDLASPQTQLGTANSRNNLYTYGFNANLTYKITESSFFKLGITIIDSNNPYSLMSMYSPYLNPMGVHYGALGQSYGINNIGFMNW
jgi:hypothetical protein